MSRPESSKGRRAGDDPVERGDLRNWAQSYVRVEPVGPLVLKGKAAPAHRRTGCWMFSQARAAPSTVHRSPQNNLRRPARSDLAVLERCLRQVESGYRQVVDIVGEPGIGKVRGFSPNSGVKLRRRGERVTWIEGRWRFLRHRDPVFADGWDLLRSNCGVLESDTPEVDDREGSLGSGASRD